MTRLSFIIPGIAGAAVGIALAANHEGLSLVTVTAVVVVVAAIVSAPIVLRELGHTGAGDGTMPPYARIREELAAAGVRGPSLVHTRDLLALAGNAYDLHFRLRPILIGVVGDLLALRARIDFHDRPDLAHEHLGPQLWEVIRPDRPVPEGRFSDPGLDPAQIDRLISDLEALTARAPTERTPA
jgi:hypothetical protein